VADANALRFRQYPADTGAEWMLIHGPSTGTRVLILGPVLNEMNLMRAVTVDMARRLAQRGHACAIPDLPGCGESMTPLRTVEWRDWRAAAAAAAEAWRGEDGSPPHIVSLRGGCLLDDDCAAASRWRFAPAEGSALVRPLQRAHRIANREGVAPEDEDGGVPLAGFTFAPAFLDALRAAQPATVSGPLRNLEAEKSGVPRWRRAEPGADAALSERLSADIADWISSCAS
jgi:hypothetical protein